MTQHRHQQSLGHLTGLASRLFNRLLTQRFKQASIDMTAEQWGVILVLKNHALKNHESKNSEPMTQSQISELLYLEKSSVSRSIDGLEKRGWIERQRSPSDSRSKFVSLTQQSLAVVERCSEIAATVLADAQQGIEEAELERTKQHLAQVVRQLRQLNH
ncbi:MarR family winged helix-turn-helix transcriptional regulator [Vibrio furnissii]|uniref:MarR family winged helix-turn-helix transcriptional regulator n=1 Tax=Vibrio furnissii TaxID=29494 RepID=UPI0001B918FC|nr:MarR family transcriptional regulator [Vibrio furnissii]EEX41034.1 MarR family transcriptional regulator [Vibrio furnissii CIP 102972]QDC94322.1 MarR family transcriptional regulator [Vibrio furnissii]UON51129.1 MarR family transcriptional regulator [Vibrio furnissii]SUQ33464.1 MarR family transcriptional regulator [Vibrio furnissii]